MSDMKIHFVISPAEYAQDFGQACIAKWGQSHLLQASYVVSLGGDGTALVAKQEVLSAYLLTGKMLPVYNIDCSNSADHVGALTNHSVSKPDGIRDALMDAKKIQLYPLQADCEMLNDDVGGKYRSYYGFNEIAVKVKGYEMTYLDVDFCGESVCIKGDGVVIATPLGKRGYYYNLSGMDFSDNQIGIQSIASRQNVNRILSDDEIVQVKVKSKHRLTCVMRDCNLISSPILSAKIYKSKISLTVLKDRQRD